MSDIKISSEIHKDLDISDSLIHVLTETGQLCVSHDIKPFQIYNVHVSRYMSKLTTVVINFLYFHWCLNKLHRKVPLNFLDYCTYCHHGMRFSFFGFLTCLFNRQTKDTFSFIN